MFKLNCISKSFALGILCVSSLAFAEESEWNDKTTENITSSGIVKFPSNVMGTVFSQREYNQLKSRLEIAKKDYPIYENLFLTYGGWGYADAKLLAALAATESNMCRGGRTSSDPYYCSTKSNTGALGLMQFTSSARNDVRQNKSLMRGLPISDNDFLRAPTAIAGAAVQMRQQKLYSTQTLKSSNARDYIRAYNAGTGCISKLQKGESIGNWCTKTHKAKEAAQYPYIVAYMYYGLGGKSAIFKEMLEGKDPFIEKVFGVKQGTGSLDITGAEENNTTLYVRTEPVCKMETLSPLKGITTLPVSNTYGERYDSTSGKNRKNTYVQFSATENTPVLAISRGTVLNIENNPNGLGHVLKVQNDDGSVWVYASIKSIQTENGAIVESGQHIGYVSADNTEKTPMLILGYFKDAKKSLALEETNDNFDDPLSHYCGNVDIPSDFTVDTGALSEMVTEIKTEQANSQIGALESLVNNRLSNAQWLSDISVMSEPRLLAEIAYIKAIRLQIRTINQQVEDRFAVLKAAKVALLREQTLKEETNQLYKAVSSEH